VRKRWFRVAKTVSSIEYRVYSEERGKKRNASRWYLVFSEEKMKYRLQVARRGKQYRVSGIGYIVKKGERKEMQVVGI